MEWEQEITTREIEWGIWCMEGHLPLSRGLEMSCELTNQADVREPQLAGLIINESSAPTFESWTIELVVIYSSGELSLDGIGHSPTKFANFEKHLINMELSLSLIKITDFPFSLRRHCERNEVPPDRPGQTGSISQSAFLINSGSITLPLLFISRGDP
jgi:hypothetical protein